MKEGRITEKMLEECLYSVNKRAKNYRDKEREYREYNRNARRYCRYYYDKYDNEEQMRNKKEMFYEQKEIMLSILQPTCIHKEFLGYEKERIYDYDDRYANRRKYNKKNKIVWENCYYDHDEDREVYFFDIKTDKARYNYYLFYQLGNKTFHSPIAEEDLNIYDYLEIIEIDHLETEGHDIIDLLSCQFCTKVVELIKSGNFTYDGVSIVNKNNYNSNNHIIINNITFYYDINQIKLTNKIIQYLEEFSKDAEDEAYSVYIDSSAGIIVY